ncbi:TRAP transporter substrate-binding protein [Pseudonocardia kunmingensis]|uniref:Tripartite ATP-independent transporter DctP family solute receptor n=1 Tax=Pseudonocardia kunmingensis TaxID=630975 RepID=A0A543DVM5_9PSEU|nr:TRAP transporter substrate-binding protein [Pseudonocardia kunmingensis]TQM13381.1 tripartite ATP-independent transporter DctP family solute receptor [Pseudonocardia kunmingensis]
MIRRLSRRSLLRWTGTAAGAALLATAACGTRTTFDEDGRRLLRLGYIMSEGDPGHAGAVRLAELVAERSDTLRILPQPNGLLGGEQDLWEGLHIGSIDMALTGVGPISFFTPQFAGVQMYYAIRDLSHLDAVFHGAIGREVAAALLEAKRGRILDWWHRGARQVTANRPIREPADLRGLKLRCPEGRTYIESWRSLGASPTPMALGELFTALEQGVVDAQENPLELIESQSMSEVQSHVSMTSHQYAAFLMAVSERTWQQLSAAEQDLLHQAVVDAGTFEKRAVQDIESTARAALRDDGMAVVEDVDIARFEEICLDTARRLETEGLWQSGLYERVREAA